MRGKTAIPESAKRPTLAVSCEQLLAFDTDLGWMAVLVDGSCVRQLSFGHAKAELACKEIRGRNEPQSPRGRWQAGLVDRLKAYAAGAAVDFSDLEIGWGTWTEFRKSVLNACRKIGYGKTLSYSELANLVGSDGAARAVGNCMATNRVPLLIPCHRVVSAHGRLGNYSAAGGIVMKRRLLDMEGAGFVCIGSRLI